MVIVTAFHVKNNGVIKKYRKPKKFAKLITDKEEKQ
jgi:hypothetical protein